MQVTCPWAALGACGSLTPHPGWNNTRRDNTRPLATIADRPGEKMRTEIVLEKTKVRNAGHHATHLLHSVALRALGLEDLRSCLGGHD